MLLHSDPRIGIGDEVVAVDLTTGTRSIASVRDLSGTVLTLDADTCLGIGDAVKVEHRQGLMLGEVVDEQPSEPNCLIRVRCHGWLGPTFFWGSGPVDSQLSA